MKCILPKAEDIIYLYGNPYKIKDLEKLKIDPVFTDILLECGGRLLAENYFKRILAGSWRLK